MKLNIACRSVERFPNYFVSDIGYVFSKAREKQCGHKGSKPQKLNQRLLKGRETEKGYLSVILHNNKKKKSFRVHRLIYQSFVEAIPEGKEINHINGDKQDNRIENLEAITHGDNIRHAERNGMINHAKGELAAHAKLNENEVIWIRIKYSDGATLAALAKEYGVHTATIHRIIKRKTWKHVPNFKTKKP